jgi:hypothetical protein
LLPVLLAKRRLYVMTCSAPGCSPAALLSAVVRGETLSPHGPAFAIDDARRLHEHTERLLAASA